MNEGLKNEISLTAVCVCVRTSSRHAIATQQYETVMRGLRSVCETSKHVDVWHVEWR